MEACCQAISWGGGVHAAKAPLGTCETDTLLKMGFQTYILFCSKVPSECRKCRFRDQNFKIFPWEHAPP